MRGKLLFSPSQSIIPYALFFSAAKTQRGKRSLCELLAFSLASPPKMLGGNPLGFPPSPFPQGGKLLFPHNKADFCVSKKRKEENEVFLKPLALFRVFRVAALRVFSLRSSSGFAFSAFGDQKTFSEEKVFWIFKKTFFASRDVIHKLKKIRRCSTRAAPLFYAR